jgi:hypothetical protein
VEGATSESGVENAEGRVDTYSVAYVEQQVTEGWWDTQRVEARHAYEGEE